jgi:hypothetical protein
VPSSGEDITTIKAVKGTRAAAIANVRPRDPQAAAVYSATQQRRNEEGRRIVDHQVHRDRARQQREDAQGRPAATYERRAQRGAEERAGQR